MGNQRNVKQIRGQLRQIVKEIMPDLLAGKALSDLHENANKQIGAKLELVDKYVKTTMEGIDERAKDIQAYLVRQTTTVPGSAPEGATLEPTAVPAEASKQE